MAKFEKNTETEALSKAEKARLEREERLKHLRDEDVVKKNAKQAGGHSKGKVAFTVVAVIVVLALVLYIFSLFGVPQRTLPALKINQQTLNAVDYNYAYNSNFNLYNQYYGNGGLLNLRASSKSVTQEDITWGEFFRKNAENSLKEESIIYQKALDANYKLTDEDQKKIDDQMKQMQTAIGKPLDYELYLEGSYGKGMNVASFRKIMERQMLAGKFSKEAPLKYDIKDEQVKENYEQNKNQYDLVSYHSFTLVTPTDNADGSKMTVDQLKESMGKTEELAKKIVAGLAKPEDVKKAAIENASEKDKSIYDGEKDVTLYENKNGGKISNKEVSTWLLDDSRKAGDKQYIANGSNFEIVYFLSKKQDTRKPADLMISSFAMKDQQQNLLDKQKLDAIQKAAVEMANTFKSEQDVLDYDAKEAGPDEVKAGKSMKVENLTGKNKSELNQDVVNFALSDEAKPGQAKVITTQDTTYVVFVIKKSDKESWFVDNKLELQYKAYNEDFDSWLKDSVNTPAKQYPGYWYTGK